MTIVQKQRGIDFNEVSEIISLVQTYLENTLPFYMGDPLYTPDALICKPLESGKWLAYLSTETGYEITEVGKDYLELVIKGLVSSVNPDDWDYLCATGPVEELFLEFQESGVPASFQ